MVFCIIAAAWALSFALCMALVRAGVFNDDRTW